MSEAYLGECEHLVLLSILRLGSSAYGVTVRRELREKAGRRVSVGAVYSALRRLKRKGLIAATQGEPQPVPGGRAKKLQRPELRNTSGAGSSGGCSDSGSEGRTDARSASHRTHCCCSSAWNRGSSRRRASVESVTSTR